MTFLVLALETILVLCFVFVLPARGKRRIHALGERLREAPADESIQLEFVRSFVGRWWPLAALAVAVLWLDGAKLAPPVVTMNDGDGQPLLRPLAPVVVGAVALVFAISLVFLRLIPTYRAKQIALLSRLRDAWVILPRSSSAALGFVLVSVTAGVCEELVFRRLVPVWTVHLAGERVWLPFIVSSIAFGLAHRYQGARGIVLTGLIGAALYGLVTTTGELWPAMAVHTIVDLRVAATYPVIGPIPIPLRSE